MTKQRMAILEVIEKTPGHLSADEIYLLVKKELPKISVGTVYRNLNQLCENGQLRRVNIIDGPDRYDRRLREHYHLICDMCGKAVDVDIPGLKDYIENATGKKNIFCTVNIGYICDECGKK